MSTEHKPNEVEKIFAAQKKRRALVWEAARVALIIIFGAITLLQSAEIGRLRGYVEAMGAQPAQAAPASANAPASSAPASGLPSQVGGC